jgi:hypothetical protein
LEGSTEKNCVEGSYCQVAWGTAKPVGSSLMLERVALPTKDDVEAGRRVAYRGSNRNVSANSRTTSMAAVAGARGGLGGRDIQVRKGCDSWCLG